MGDTRYVTVVSPDEPDGTKLLLEPNGEHPLTKAFKNAYSLSSPGVVYHEAPRVVRLTTQNIRVMTRQLHRLAVWPGSCE